ncbi:MAG: PAS domain S-box protein [Desulfuromonadales bacterium]|nr:PAS domain S-box protein [Desulfuromonadales bacterium]
MKKKLIMVDSGDEDMERLARLLRENGFPRVEIADETDNPEKGTDNGGGTYFDLFDNAPLGIFRSTSAGKIITANRTCARMLGYDSPDQLIREVNETNIAEALYEEPSRRAEMARFILSRSGWSSFEIRLRSRNGAVVTCSLRMRAVTCGEGEVEFHGFINDNSELKQTEEKLELKAFSIDNITDAIQWITLDTRFWNVNRAACEMLGYTREEYLSLSIADIDPSFTLEEWQNHVRELRQAGRSILHNRFHRTKDGHTLPVEISSTIFIFNGTEYYCAIVRDLTTRLKAEHDTSFFRTLIELTGDPVYVLDPADGGRMVYANRAACLHYGKSLEELRSMRIPDWDPAYDISQLESRAQEMGKGGSLRFETKHKVASGKLIPVEVTASLLELGGKGLVAGHFSDITERKLAEEKLQESEARYRGLVELYPDAIYIHTGGKLVFVNPQGAKLLGAKRPEDLYGREALDFVHPDSRDFVTKRIAHTFSTGEPNPPTEELFIRLDGTPVPVEVSSAPFDYRGEKMLQVLARDISDRKKRQEELLRAQKLESLGVLAGGIAHDFNNLLTAIMGNLSLIGVQLPEDSKSRERIRRCEKALKEATGLTCQLLTFSRGGEPVKKVIDVVSVVQSALAFVLRGSNVAAKLYIDEEIWPIEADEGQIGQVINNLVINADQSMPQGGVVRVELNNCLLPDEMADLTPGPYLRISVADQGCGIAPENLGKIFDPYFTTKKTGTGLGLSSLYSIVKKHGGEVRVSSRVGEGTVFQVYLPASPGRGKDEDRPKTTSIISGDGHVVVMDDEESIREVAKEILTYLGYRASLCASGEEAVALYGEELDRGARPLCVIMDLTVPGRMGGLEAASKLLELDPAARLIVASGYSNDPVMSDYSAYGFAQALRKPFRLEELSNAIKKIAEEGTK